MAPDAKSQEVPLAAQGTLRNMLRRMLIYVVSSAEAGVVLPFMLREIADDGPGVDHVHTRPIKPTHHHFSVVCSRACSMMTESSEVKLTVFSLNGQVLYFCIAARLVCRLMGWQGIGPVEIAVIADQLLRNLDTVLAAKEV